MASGREAHAAGKYDAGQFPFIKLLSAQTSFPFFSSPGTLYPEPLRGAACALFVARSPTRSQSWLCYSTRSVSGCSRPRKNKNHAGDRRAPLNRAIVRIFSDRLRTNQRHFPKREDSSCMAHSYATYISHYRRRDRVYCRRACRRRLAYCSQKLSAAGGNTCYAECTD